MSGADTYLLLLGPALALAFGLLVYVVARWNWAAEYQTHLRRAVEDVADQVKRKP